MDTIALSIRGTMVAMLWIKLGEVLVVDGEDGFDTAFDVDGSLIVKPWELGSDGEGDFNMGEEDIKVIFVGEFSLRVGEVTLVGLGFEKLFHGFVFPDDLNFIGVLDLGQLLVEGDKVLVEFLTDEGGEGELVGLLHGVFQNR